MSAAFLLAASLLSVGPAAPQAEAPSSAPAPSSTASPAPASSSSAAPEAAEPASPSAGEETPAKATEEDPCRDVYDRDENCPGLMLEPLQGTGEPVAPAEDDDEPLIDLLSADWLPWGLLAGGVIAVAGAAGFHAAGFFYASSLADLASQGGLSARDLNMTAAVQAGFGLGSTLMWLTAALFGGGALALWSFDPETGAIRLPFFE